MDTTCIYLPSGHSLVSLEPGQTRAPGQPVPPLLPHSAPVSGLSGRAQQGVAGHSPLSGVAALSLGPWHAGAAGEAVAAAGALN